MATQFGKRIKELRSREHMLQRQIAAKLDMDTPLFSKIERGERFAKKESVVRLAEILKADKEEFMTLWLADQIYEVAKDEDFAIKALLLAQEKIELTNKISESKDK